MNGFKYYVLFIDHFTRFTWLYLFQSKSEVFDKFVHFKNLIENQFSIKIKIFRSDGGGEYTSNILSLPYLNMVSYINFMPIHSSKKWLSWKEAHASYWDYNHIFVLSFHFNCLLVLCYSNCSLLNQLPTSVLSFHSPWQKLYYSQPNLSQLKVFDCACYPYLRSYNCHKLEPRSKECLF